MGFRALPRWDRARLRRGRSGSVRDFHDGCAKQGQDDRLSTLGGGPRSWRGRRGGDACAHRGVRSVPAVGNRTAESLGSLALVVTRRTNRTRITWSFFDEQRRARRVDQRAAHRSTQTTSAAEAHERRVGERRVARCERLVFESRLVSISYVWRGKPQKPVAAIPGRSLVWKRMHCLCTASTCRKPLSVPFPQLPPHP